jgi:integrase
MDRLSKQLNGWLRKAGVVDEKKKFQSFRGTFATRLKNAGVHEHHIAELLGHENDNITTGRYGKKSELSTLLAAVSKLTLPV